MDAVGTQTKNAIQITTSVGKQVKTYNALLQEFCKTQRSEAALIVHVQVRGNQEALHGRFQSSVADAMTRCFNSLDSARRG